METKNFSFDLDTYKNILRKSSLFRDIPEDKYGAVLNCLQARIEYYPAGTPIVNAGDRDFYAGMLLDGSLDEFIYDENVNPVSISHLESGSIFGAELTCGNTLASQYYLNASVDSKVLLLDFQILLNTSTLSCPNRMQVTANLLQEFANQITFFNTKVRILSQKKLRNKIKVYLQTQEISEDGTIQIPFSRNKMAEFLYVDRSALSRELCRMRDGGILAFSGSKITIIDRNFLIE